MGSNRWLFLAFLGGSFFILFFNLWGRTLENHDYLRYAEVAKEMIQSGDWVVPRLNGEIFLHKPPLLFWLIALPSKIYGSATPFLARLPSALFAWVGGLIVYLWGRKIWGGERYGLVSSGVLISSYLYFWQGRIARTDMVFSVLILLSLYFFYLSYFENECYLPPPLPAPRLRQAGSPSPVKGDGVVRDSSVLTLLSFAFMGMAGLTKGPVGVLFPLLIIFLFMLKQGQWKKLFQKEFILGYLVISFILGSWVIPFIHQAGWDTALGVWKESKILTRHEPIYLYFYRIWIDFAPWSIFLPLLFIQLWEKDKNQGETFLILWFLTLFILLTLFPYRTSKYLLPAFPALALLMGGYWRKWSLVPFLIIFFGAVLVWHGYEYSLIHKNHIRTPGLALHQALSPHREKEILGYQMDIDILGKINFYGDKLIPQIRRIEDLRKMVREKRNVLILTTNRSFRDLMEEGFYLAVLRKIDIKGEILILASLNDF